MIRSTHYAALGVDDHERAEVIHGAYRDLARRYHPARVGPGGEENFRVIADAYRVLADSSLRRFYDDARSRGDRARPERQSPSIIGDPRVYESEPLEVPAETLSLHRADILALPNGAEMLARFARNFTGVGVPKSESADCLHIRLVIAAQHLGAGVVVNLGLPVLIRCEACAGHGATSVVQCGRCDGSGFVESERAVALTIAETSADRPGDLSLAPIGIHNFYLRAIVQVDSTFN